MNLTGYAGERVRLAFFHTADEEATSYGWYIDDVTINLVAPEFGGDFAAGRGDWYADNGLWQIGTPTVGPDGCYEGTQCAAIPLDDNDPGDTDSRLITPSFRLSKTEDHALSFWQ